MKGLIDTHCHLDRLKEIEPALELAKDLGLSGMITVGTSWTERQKQLDLLRHDQESMRIWCSLGTHPDHAHEEPVPSCSEMVSDLEKPGVVAIGETGLDYFHGSEDKKPQQKAYFRRHIEASRLTGLPVIIHTRMADEDMVSILQEEQEKGAFPFLIHCFASGEFLAKAVLELGGYLSFSGLLTFPKCTEIRDVARQAPADRILVETDSPFLAPVPKRGKENTPAYVRFTAERLAQERGVSYEDIVDITRANSLRLFSKLK
ncbi:TatD family hydrolase [Aristophania vespae]|uniref:TatD family hydrolase n=1 Tax=Aristophania vespae TaxID=2697033 RepID=UPI00235136C3|nr:TatD family hydrolase [Aristophania vespae]UMM63339.1 putative metal-dependent hydrolase YcfH [Aristophania vespae]